MDGKERERIQGLIDRHANWIIQDRGGDHDYLRTEIARLQKLLDDERCAFGWHNPKTCPAIHARITECGLG